MSVYTTEIASDEISSDNPIHQRLLKPYFIIQDELKGDVLEIGCGEGRGVKMMIDQVDSFTAVDKIKEVVEKLSQEYPKGKFMQMTIPPLRGLEDNSYDLIVSFQVIEHIRDDMGYLREILRVLKPGGKAILTTPNKSKSLSRNPWHIREYTSEELTGIASQIFPRVTMQGISGNEKVMEYYEKNKASVRKFTRWDIFNLQYNLPASILRVPYEILNRLNRKTLEKADDTLVNKISHEDYVLVKDGRDGLDLFLTLQK